MPVTTRSKGSILPAPTPKTKPLRASKHSFSTTTQPKLSTNTQSIALKRPRKRKGDQSYSQRSRKKSHRPQDPNQQEQSRTNATSNSSLVSPNTVMSFWPCRQECSCKEGNFKRSLPECLNCGHTIDDHIEEYMHSWNSGCDFLSERQDLVHNILELAQDKRVVVIRATPQVGKTTLLRLLGYHILHHRLDLEPVFVLWIKQYKRLDSEKSVERFLASNHRSWQKENATYRPHNPKARPVYLIDEAQGSYDEENLWTQVLKNKNTRSQPIFILVCLYGAAGTSHLLEPHVESQALLVDSVQRVELRPSTAGHLYMLFQPKDTATAVTKWALHNNYRFDDSMPGYIHSATDGHPGMVGLILRHFEMIFDQLPEPIRSTRTWSTSLCHEILVEHEGWLDWLTESGRGVWTPRSENYTQTCLRWHAYSHISFSDVVKALREVAIRPSGLTRLPQDFDAFAFCYKMGYLHVEQSKPKSKERTYIFASPIHRRVAYRRLFPGPEPGTSLEKVGLQQVCINAIARFSPSALQNRPTGSDKRWGIPEAAFQDEIYCCLNQELRNLPILTEYSHTSDGRIDFYIFGQKWGIEVMQCGSSRELAEHVGRFKAGGKYQKWNIIEDYVILNFCTKSAFRKINTKVSCKLGLEVELQILHVVLDIENFTADIYTHDKRKRATLTLGEDRNRLDQAHFGSQSPDIATAVLQSPDGSTTQVELEGKRNMEERERELERARKELEQDKKEIRVKEEMREKMNEEMREKEEKMNEEMRVKEEIMNEEMREKMNEEMRVKEEKMNEEMRVKEEIMNEEMREKMNEEMRVKEEIMNEEMREKMNEEMRVKEEEIREKMNEEMREKMKVKEQEFKDMKQELEKSGRKTKRKADVVNEQQQTEGVTRRQRKKLG
ncbi:hypothetical protein BDV95DRAFT_644473 [Massariosphaeria phaeospora]|uniref:Uncharacterized protein n=1 Tax=Massariosphaeria phaeospora TaxID=100035 RepID=A0A7C8IPS7_9PLEO|nr:hypothetical protein BDV95DRAFT_644473 [Massariosphaeria phaeospora]